jgi:hypothetical protein
MAWVANVERLARILAIMALSGAQQNIIEDLMPAIKDFLTRLLSKKGVRVDPPGVQGGLTPPWYYHQMCPGKRERD